MFGNKVPDWRPKFDAEHGESVVYKGYLIFEDGAEREQGPMGAAIQPPEDPHRRARAIERFHKVLDRAVEEFQEYRAILKESARHAERLGNSPPDVTELDRLRQLQEVVTERTAAHKAALEQVEATVPEHVRDSERMKAENQRVSGKFLTELGKIRI